MPSSVTTGFSLEQKLYFHTWEDTKSVGWVTLPFLASFVTFHLYLWSNGCRWQYARCNYQCLDGFDTDHQLFVPSPRIARVWKESPNFSYSSDISQVFPRSGTIAPRCVSRRPWKRKLQGHCVRFDPFMLGKIAIYMIKDCSMCGGNEKICYTSLCRYTHLCRHWNCSKLKP